MSITERTLTKKFFRIVREESVNGVNKTERGFFVFFSLTLNKTTVEFIVYLMGL